MNLYTIGYATKPLTSFIQHLRRYNIDVVADIRSVPYSKIFKEYHRESIEAYLRKNKIRYVYLGDELGPRSKDPKHYNDTGQVQFERLMQSPLFIDGVKRLKIGVETKGFNVALMCAEKDPAICHRSLLVGYYLQRKMFSKTQATEDNSSSPLRISHILHNGELESQNELESRISNMHNCEEQDLFMTEDERNRKAYEKQLVLTSYKKPT